LALPDGTKIDPHSGAGIAGPALALLAAASRIKAVLVERAVRFRKGGYMIDSWGIGFVLAERLPLGDLAEAIFNIVADNIETIFGDSITAIREDRIGVDVQFENGRPRRFDLIAGCDGLHSAVRELLWAPTTLGWDYSCGVWSCARRGSLL